MNILAPTIPNDIQNIDNIVREFDEEEDVSSVVIDGQIATALETKSCSIRDSLITKTDFSYADMEKFDIANCIIKNTNLSASKFHDSGWRTVHIDGCRCSGLQLQNSSIKNVRITNSKLDLVNFRLATLESVIFEDCVLDDTDFYGANLKNVAFINCTIAKISFAGAKLRSVDLSQSSIESIQGLESIKGATISHDQLIQLAPYFAAEIGIKIK